MDMNNLKNIEISKLALDKYNPRLPLSKRTGKEEDIINYLLLESATIDLMEAIAENGYFPGELLLVVPSSNNKYIVVEGNRRLCSVKLLNNPDLAKYKKASVQSIVKSAKKTPPLELPCLVFDRKEDIQKYLGFVHVTGKQPWGLLQKARYLWGYYEQIKTSNFEDDCRSIAKSIGSKGPYVSRLLLAFQIYKKVEDEAFYGIEHLDDTSFYLNYLVDGLNKENIRLFLGCNTINDILIDINESNLKELIGWWFEKTEGITRAKGDSESLKKLNAILGNPDALEAFRCNGITLERAYMMTSDYGTQVHLSILTALKEMQNVDNLIVSVSDFYSTILDDLSAIAKTTKKIITYIKTQSEEDDD